MADGEDQWQNVIRGLRRRLAAMRTQSHYGTLGAGTLTRELRELVSETRALYSQYRQRLDVEGREQFTSLLNDMSQLMYRCP